MISNVLAVDLKSLSNESVQDSVGNILKCARVAQGLTINNIAQETKIRAFFLKCLEEDNFSALPGTVYVIGFIRTYCEHLKIPADLVVSNYLASSGQTDAELPFKVYVSQVSQRKISSRIVFLSLCIVGASSLLWCFFKTEDLSKNINDVRGGLKAFSKKEAHNKVDLGLSVENVKTTELSTAKSIEDKALSTTSTVEKPVDKTSINGNHLVYKKPALLNAAIASFSIEAIEETWMKITNCEGICVKALFLNKGDTFDLTGYVDNFISVGNAENIIIMAENTKISGASYLETLNGFAENKKIVAPTVKNSIQISNTITSASKLGA
ncbi:MAG: helix-turn-helix domain-containing protein [Candidatus Paracaedibacteraceae bacterium]|nr:helix-turn-helix domain-containing protein [Candidatus Paracaedibacteraceae bacterium]